MAAGKTTVGKELSERLGAPMIDTDAYIEENEGKTISEIFEESGESGFRKIEETCLEDILEEHIAEHPETLEDKTSKADIETLFERLSKDTGGRTLLENRGDVPLRQVIERLYKEREPFYEALARTTV